MKLMDPTTKKKSVCRPNTIRVYDAGGDISRRWFVEYRDQENQKRRVFTKINDSDVPEDRREAIQHVIARLTGPEIDRYELIRNLREFLNAKENNIRKKTFQGYSSKFRVFAEWYEGQVIDTHQADAFLDWLVEKRGLHMTSRNDYRVFLKSAWKWMMKKGMKKMNPWDRTEKVTQVSISARPFSMSQVAHLKKIMMADVPGLWMFCEMMFYTFIRPGEMRELRVSDILWEDCRILVRAEISKNRKEQYVVIPDALFPNLLAWCENTVPTDYLFSNMDGQRPGKNMLGKNFMSSLHRDLLRKLEYASQHKLYSWKHTGAKYAALAGVSMKELQVQLRHHSLDQVDMYLRDLGVQDLTSLANRFPKI